MLPTMYHAGILVVTLFAYALAGNLESLKPQKTADEDSSDTALAPVGDSNGDQTLQMSEFCFFGKFPSATCRFKCHLMSLEAYCDEEQKKCLCTEVTTPKASEEGSQELFQKPQTHKEQEEEKAHKTEVPKPAPEKETQKTTSEEAQKTTPAEASATPAQTFTIPMQTSVQEPEEDQNKHHVVFYIFDLNKIFGPQPTDNETKVSEETQTVAPEAQGATPAGWPYQHFIALLIIVLLLVLIALELFACYKKQRAKNHDMETIFKNIPMPHKA